MENFAYRNPVRLVFGRGVIAELPRLLVDQPRILLLYGGGSIRKNGVYGQVAAALKGFEVVEFGGVEPNPDYDMLMHAVEICRKERISFVLAVGGGSVADSAKFIAAAVPFAGDPWDLVTKWPPPVERPLAVGCVLTLPATGSEANGWAVISRRSIPAKLAFGHDLLIPQFSILDPETTFTLDARQTANGIVDAFVHVLEQYLTYAVGAHLQDRQAEAVLQVLAESGPAVLIDPRNYLLRANVMWCATQAQSGLLGCGVPGDWATHMIGHELTALYGLDHARTLSVVWPALARHQKHAKAGKLMQFGQRVWGLRNGRRLPAECVKRTEQFFRDLGMPTRLKDCGVNASEAADRVSERLAKRNKKFGERGHIGAAEARQILLLAG